MNRLSLQDRARILGCLVEGNSLRAITRMTGNSVNTVTKLLVDLGTACGLYQNETLRNLPCERLQFDEIWSFCYAKQKNVKPWRDGVLGFGDAPLFLENVREVLDKGVRYIYTHLPRLLSGSAKAYLKAARG